MAKPRSTTEESIDLADTMAWIAGADEEIERTVSEPNRLLDHLLDAGCKVSFVMHADGTRTTADILMPDDSTVTETGLNPVHALILAYSAGAWLADLPRLLLAAAAPPADDEPAKATPPALSVVRP